MYQGVKISLDQLSVEYKRIFKEEQQRLGERYPEARAEKVLETICPSHALWSADQSDIGIRAAMVLRASSLRKLGVYPQSLRFLDTLKGSPLVIVSNGQRVYGEIEFRYLGLYDRFDTITFSSDLGFRKPDPRIFQKVLDKMGFRPEEALFVGGDNLDNDIVPIVKLGMNAMHVEEAWRFFRVT